MIKQSWNCSVSVKISKFPKAVKVLVTPAAEQSLIRYQQHTAKWKNLIGYQKLLFQYSINLFKRFKVYNLMYSFSFCRWTLLNTRKIFTIIDNKENIGYLHVSFKEISFWRLIAQYNFQMTVLWKTLIANLHDIIDQKLHFVETDSTKQLLDQCFFGKYLCNLI